MAHIVCIIGNKGGTGKTTLTHLLAHGLGLLGHRAVAALTDRDREPLSKTHRLYLPVDARTPEAGSAVFADPGEVLAEEARCARGRLLQPRGHRDQRGLPRA